MRASRDGIPRVALTNAQGTWKDKYSSETTESVQSDAMARRVAFRRLELACMVIGGASDAKPSMPLHASGRPTAIRELIVLRAVPLAHPSSAASSRCPTSHITTASAAPIASSILGGSESGQLSSVSRALQNSAMMQEAFGSPGGLHCSPAGSRPTTTRASPSNGSREMPVSYTHLTLPTTPDV